METLREKNYKAELRKHPHYPEIMQLLGEMRTYINAKNKELHSLLTDVPKELKENPDFKEAYIQLGFMAIGGPMCEDNNGVGVFEYGCGGLGHVYKNWLHFALEHQQLMALIMAGAKKIDETKAKAGEDDEKDDDEDDGPGDPMPWEDLD